MDDINISIAIGPDGKLLVTGAENPEVVSLPFDGKAAEKASNGPVVEPAPATPTAKTKAKKVGAVAVDDRHPYVICFEGMPLFAASSPMPERLQHMLAKGVAASHFQLLDTRTGEVGQLNIGGPDGK